MSLEESRGFISSQQFLNSWLISWQKKDPETRWEWEEGGARSGWTRTGPGVVFSLACPIIIPFGSIQLADLLERRWGQAVLEAAVGAVLVVVKGFNSGRVQARGLNSHLCVL